MTGTPHLWVRAEQRQNESRVGITPDRAAALIERGFQITIEDNDTRAIGIEGYAAAGCTIAPAHMDKRPDKRHHLWPKGTARGRNPTSCLGTPTRGNHRRKPY